MITMSKTFGASWDSAATARGNGVVSWEVPVAMSGDGSAAPSTSARDFFGYSFAAKARSVGLMSVPPLTALPSFMILPGRS